MGRDSAMPMHVLYPGNLNSCIYLYNSVHDIKYVGTPVKAHQALFVDWQAKGQQLY